MINRVLFLKEKYYGGNPELGLTNNEALLVEPLQETGLVGEIKVFYFDELSRQLGQHLMGEVLLEICAKDRPDLVIFIVLGVLGLDPPRSIMKTIANILGIRVYLQRHDSVGEEGHRFTDSWFPFVSHIGFMDATLAHLGYSQNLKAIQTFTNFSSKYFYDRKLERDIDVSFLGSVNGWPRRAEYIQFLRDHGVNVLVRGGRGTDFLSVEDYSKIMSRSKMSLSFTLNPNGNSQMKGRTLESMGCKSLVIEDEGTETREFFDQGKDFVMSRSKEEILEKIKYYLEHNEERERIAQSGHRKVTRVYTSRNKWGYVLEKMGFELPASLVKDKDYRELVRRLDSL